MNVIRQLSLLVDEATVAAEALEERAQVAGRVRDEAARMGEVYAALHRHLDALEKRNAETERRIAAMEAGQ